MDCNHDPFTIETTLSLVPCIGGTDLICRACNATTAFDALGSVVTVIRNASGFYGAVSGTFDYSAGTYAENLAAGTIHETQAEHIVLDGETARWRCDFGVEHDLGEYCACTHA